MRYWTASIRALSSRSSSLAAFGLVAAAAGKAVATPRTSRNARTINRSVRAACPSCPARSIEPHKRPAGHLGRLRQTHHREQRRRDVLKRAAFGDPRLATDIEQRHDVEGM